ncbi:hypothetical protein ITQ82_04025 [Pediococcus pentosaceus]|uniref:hypothetical protein n=1 Tax=Pediococcus pentosaceus TaxID=1255 RepID=UPI0018A164AB|nr:hypothetical protein [Pediococcus pentosaceus]MBF7132570.1 hypothetical protein [Pediococcus pentosaceus]
MKLNGFHGTTKNRAIAIKKNAFTIPDYSDKVPSDLGGGVYFFIEDERFQPPNFLACQYALIYKAKKVSSDVEVISVNVESDKVLDLDLEENQNNFNLVRNMFMKNFFERFTDLNSNIKKHGNLDGFILNKLIEANMFTSQSEQPQVIIKSTYTPFCKGTVSNVPNGKEMSVRDVDLIHLAN